MSFCMMSKEWDGYISKRISSQYPYKFINQLLACNYLIRGGFFFFFFFFFNFFYCPFGFTTIVVANKGLEIARGQIEPGPPGPTALHPLRRMHLLIFWDRAEQTPGKGKKSALPLVGLELMTLGQESESLTTAPPVTPKGYYNPTALQPEDSHTKLYDLDTVYLVYIRPQDSDRILTSLGESFSLLNHIYM